MTELKLAGFCDIEDEPETYPFPQGCSDGGRGEEARATLLDFDEEHCDSLELARRMESALDDLQRRIDRVKEEMDAAYQFPGPEDWPPSAA